MYFKKALLISTFLILPTFLYTQTKKSIEIQLDSARILSTISAEDAINLYKKLIDDSQKIKFDQGTLLSKDGLSTVYFNNGDYENVIKLSGDIEKLSLKLKDYRTLAGIYRSVGASYSMLRLNEQALQSLDKAKVYAEKIEDKSIRHYNLALIYDSYSVCIGDANNDVNQMLHFVEKSIAELENISDKEIQAIIEAKYDLLGFQYFRLADLYFSELKQNSKAGEYYEKALKIYENPLYNIQPNNKAVLYGSLANFYFAQKEYNKTILHGKEALKLTDQFDQPEIRKEVYDVLFKSYLELGQKDQSKYYAELSTKLNDSLKQAERAGVNTSLEKIISQKEEDHKKRVNVILIILGIVIATVVLLIFQFRSKTKNIHKKYEEFLLKLRNEQDSKADVKIPSKKIEGGKSTTITDETTNDLLQKLEKFENSNKYLKKEISLTWLANNLNTNTKYLSEIIKVHKNKSFTDYLNGLRIDYITKKLVAEPKYREYKIDYLGEECGYKSRQVFVIAFKKETGFTPSYFIENLKNEFGA